MAGGPLLVAGGLVMLVMGGSGGGRGGGAGGALVCDTGGASVSATDADGAAVDLDATQVSNAALVVGSGSSMGRQAQVVAVVTALQESGLRNLANDGSFSYPAGSGVMSEAEWESARAVVVESMNLPHDGVGSDWDSIGLFQQRPSAGWGSVGEIMDPATSAATFYSRLSGVAGWESMSAAEAAQTVQVSQFPDAYARWEPVAPVHGDARIFPGPVRVHVGVRHVDSDVVLRRDALEGLLYQGPALVYERDELLSPLLGVDDLRDQPDGLGEPLRVRRFGIDEVGMYRGRLLAIGDVEGEDDDRDAELFQLLDERFGELVCDEYDIGPERGDRLDVDLVQPAGCRKRLEARVDLGDVVSEEPLPFLHHADEFVAPPQLQDDVERMMLKTDDPLHLRRDPHRSPELIGDDVSVGRHGRSRKEYKGQKDERRHDKPRNRSLCFERHVDSPNRV